MILSVSRRTDIPAFYSEWFFNRLREGYACVRNPMNARQVSKINISPEVVDCIVFWTKNPAPMLPRLYSLRDYKYYFQFTLNPYGKSIEVSVDKKNSIINTFKTLSDKLGAERVIWRYDPIFFTKDIDMDYHLRYFEKLAQLLHSYTKRCVISFLDLYKKTERNMANTDPYVPNTDEMNLLASRFAGIGKGLEIEVQSCAEEIDFNQNGVAHGHCVDQNLIEKLVGYRIEAKKDPNQRNACGCIESIDIGEYNTCLHHCLYCYANYSQKQVLHKRGAHNINSPLLSGEIGPDDHIRIRPVKLLKANGLFG
mgnify:CR=1 FL=1